MKKLLKLAAVFAAFALMFGFASCSDDDDDENNDESGPATVAVESVTIDGDITEVEVGKTITLTAAVAPENATVKTVTWTSSDPAKATVKDGVVTGVTAGEVTITAASTADSTKKAEKTITVKAAATTDPDDPNPPATQEGFIEDITTSGSLYEALNPLAVKTALSDGTYGKISVTGATRGNDTSKVVLEVKGTVSFNVSAGAKIVLKAGSTSKANTSTYTLSGAATTETVSVTGTSYDEVTYNATTDGTVTLTTGTDRGVRFTYIAVSYN